MYIWHVYSILCARASELFVFMGNTRIWAIRRQRRAYGGTCGVYFGMTIKTKYAVNVLKGPTWAGGVS